MVLHPELTKNQQDISGFHAALETGTKWTHGAKRPRPARVAKTAAVFQNRKLNRSSGKTCKSAAPAGQTMLAKASITR